MDASGEIVIWSGLSRFGDGQLVDVVRFSGEHNTYAGFCSPLEPFRPLSLALLSSPVKSVA